MHVDSKALELARPILKYFNAICRKEGFPVLPCIEAHSKRSLARYTGYIAAEIKHFKDTPQKSVLEGLLKIATEYCDSPE